MPRIGQWTEKLLQTHVTFRKSSSFDKCEPQFWWTESCGGFSAETLPRGDARFVLLTHDKEKSGNADLFQRKETSMIQSPRQATEKFEGHLLVWVPDTKSKSGFRLFDSQSDTSRMSLDSLARITVRPEGVHLWKWRANLRVLIMLPSVPILSLVYGIILSGGTQFLGLSRPMEDKLFPWLFGASGLAALVTCWYFLSRWFKNLDRSVPSASIINARPLFVETESSRSGVRRGAGQLGVDFAIAPEGASSALPTLPFRECACVRFIAKDESAAIRLLELISRRVVPLSGEVPSDVPPFQAMPRAMDGNPAPRFSPPSQEKRFALDTRDSWVTRILLTLVFGYVFFIAAQAALFDRREMLINGLIPLGSAGATLLRVLVAGMIGIGFSIFVRGSLQRLFNPHFITLGTDAISFNRGIFRPQILRLPYGSIKGLPERQPVRGGLRTCVVVTDERHVAIMEARLPSAEDYNTIKGVLESQIRNAQISAHSARSSPG